MKHTTTYLYIPQDKIINGEVHFPEDESVHLSQVLRAKSGDEIIVVDGAGSAYRVEITRSKQKYSRGRIIEQINPSSEPKFNFSLALGTIRPRRMETAWDFCVQLGMNELIPIHTKYSTDRMKADGKYMDRLRAVSIRAMKQSKRAVLPGVRDPISISELLLAGSFEYIFYGDSEGLPGPPLKKPRLGERVLLVIGPEGGFSSEEIRELESQEAIPISLGPRRLRAETAAVTLSVIALKWTNDI